MSNPTIKDMLVGVPFLSRRIDDRTNGKGSLGPGIRVSETHWTWMYCECTSVQEIQFTTEQWSPDVEIIDWFELQEVTAGNSVIDNTPVKQYTPVPIIYGSPCTHSFVQKHLFMSTYMACEKCGVER